MQTTRRRDAARSKWTKAGMCKGDAAPRVDRRELFSSRDPILLAILARHGEMYSRQLAEQYEFEMGEAVHPVSVYAGARRLEGLGFIKRKRGDVVAGDTRQNVRYWIITRKGLRYVELLRLGYPRLTHTKGTVNR